MMSLSEAPSVKIKYNTPQEVSDEILGGAIQLCRETGYKQNVMMLTFFWSAFLFTARKSLEENGILTSTASCFISSISKVFPKIKEDVEAKENINNIREHYWNQLSADFINLNTEDEISYLIKIADELNANGNTGTTNPTAKEPDKIFARISSTINSSIDQILHDYDSGLTIRYRNIPDEIRFEQNLNKTEKGASKSAKAAKKENHLGMAWYKYLIYFGLVAGSIINILYSISYFTGTIYLSGTNGQVTADQIYSHFGVGLKIVDIMYGLFLIAFAILGFVLRKKLANFESDSLKFVIIFYSLAAGAPFLYSVLSALITSTSITVQSILSAIFGVIMLLLNIKYFKKRAHLFTDEAVEEKMIAPTPEKQPRDAKRKPHAVKKTKKPVNKKALLLFTITPVILVIISLVIVFVLVPGIKYANAKKLLENGNYELAYSAFQKLDGYSDSEDMLLECRYVQAIKYRDAGDFEVANKIFESLGGYRDSEILIHEHNHRIVTHTSPTCTETGSEVLECLGCKDSYTNYLNASHNYIVTETIDSSCVAVGNISFECTICHNTYSEVIAIKSHNYSPATCTEPKTCKMCGKTVGSALGHSASGVMCSRCGKIIFKTLHYSGTGSKVIDYSVPKGKFKITATMTSGQGSVEVKVHYTGTYGDTYEMLDIFDMGNSKVAYIYGPTSGTIVVNASNNYFGKSGWKLSIEAVEN